MFYVILLCITPSVHTTSLSNPLMDDCVVAGLYYFVNVPAEIPQPLKMSTGIFLGVKMAAA
jgi:hypothetical protein